MKLSNDRGALQGLLKGRKKSTLAGDLAGVCAEASRTAEVRETEFESGDRVLAFSIAPVADETYINIDGRDITELKRREQELAEEKTLLEAVFENMDQGISLVDADLNAAAFNRRFLELLVLPVKRFRPGESFEAFIRH